MAAHMRTSFAHLRLFLTVLALQLVTGTAAAADIWVITDSRHPVSGTHKPTRVILLDAAQHNEAELSGELPNEPQRAAALAQRRLQETGQTLQQRLRDTYQGIADAWSLGITSLPAVVVDQRYVVYGETDLDRAVLRIENYRRSQP